MRDILPEIVIQSLHDRYVAAVSDAESTFDMNRADEDSLTGALGQSIAMPVEQTFSGPNGAITVKISYKKLRGRGWNAPEKRYGSDGIFQIEVLDRLGTVIRAKGLPFQSKKEWKGNLPKLAEQAADMEINTPGGIVIDFNKQGYSACMASAVVAAQGNRASVVQADKMHRLGQLLGNEFLNCEIGIQDLYFDAEQEEYAFREALHHVISTEVVIDR